MTLNASGNLSLGNTNDTFKLDVTGQIRVNGSTNQQLIIDYTTASGGFTWQSFRINGANKYRFLGNADNSFALYSDTAATQVLTIASSGAATFSSSVTAAGVTVSGGNTLQLSGGTGNNWQLYKDINNGLQFYLSGGGPAMYINSSQNVGIGTTSPAAKLDVNGNAFFGSSAQMKIIGTDNGGIDYFAADGTTFNIRTTAYNNPIVFSQVSGERMRISSGGEVLVNSTSTGLGFVNASKFGSYQPYTTDSNSSAMSSQRTAGMFAISGGDNSNNQGAYTAIVANVQFGASSNPGSIFRGYGNGTLAIQIRHNGNVEIETGSIKTGEPDTGWGRSAIKIGASVSGAAFDVTRYLPVSVDGTVYYINLNSSTP
jgi:hypothetical protein